MRRCREFASIPSLLERCSIVFGAEGGVKERRRRRVVDLTSRPLLASRSALLDENYRDVMSRHATVQVQQQQSSSSSSPSSLSPSPSPSPSRHSRSHSKRSRRSSSASSSQSSLGRVELDDDDDDDGGSATYGFDPSQTQIGKCEWGNDCGVEFWELEPLVEHIHQGRFGPSSEGGRTPFCFSRLNFVFWYLQSARVS